MAYKTEELEKMALEAIEKNRLFFVTDISAFLPCSQSTFYDHKLEQSEDIKEALNKNRVEVKSSMRSKWYKSDNATLQVALMKLVADEDERKRLSQTYTDLTSGGEKLTVSLVEYIGEDDESDTDQESSQDTDTVS